MTYDASNDLDPYAPTTFQKGQTTPTLEDVLVKALRRTTLDLRVCMPCKIEEVRSAQFVDVRPLLSQRVLQEVKPYPVVAGVLVCMPVSAGYSIQLPLQKGDTGLLLCMDRAMDGYIAGDGTTPVDPLTDRNHELTDGVFIPGLVPMSLQTAQTKDLKLTNGSAALSLQKTGQITFTNGQDELMQLLVGVSNQLNGLTTALAKAKVMTPAGPGSFSPDTIDALTMLGAAVRMITSGLTRLKGS